MPSFNPALPITKTTDLTKQLRTRDPAITLLSLLPVAESLLRSSTPGSTSSTNIHFPRKEEWLLEWAIQRLREDEDSATTTASTTITNARLSTRFWHFLALLLQRMDPATSARGLRKHGFLNLLERTVGDCSSTASPEWVSASARKGKGADADGDGDIDMSEATDGEDSGSPRDGGIGDGGRRRKRRKVGSIEEEEAVEVDESLHSLLAEMGRVVKFLQDVAAGKLVPQVAVAGGSGSGSVVPVFRGTPEMGGQILGGYLHNLLRVVGYQGGGISSGGEDEAVAGIDAMVGVWRGCVYGNSDLKKISSIFSKSCLLPIFSALCTPISQSASILPLEKLISEYIFHPALLASSSSPSTTSVSRPNAGKKSASSSATEALKSELKSLLAPLSGLGKAQGDNGNTHDIATGINNLLRIAITTVKSSHLNASETIESILQVLLSVIFNVDITAKSSHLNSSSTASLFPERDASIIASMLTLIHTAGLSISDDALRTIVSLSANLPYNRGEASAVRWTIIELALTLDFDTFVMSQSTSLLGRLVSALSDSWAEKASTSEGERETLVRIVGLLLGGFLRARDLDGFFSFWHAELKELYAIGGEGGVLASVWTAEKVVSSVANVIERGYSAPKIEKVAVAYLDALNKARQKDEGKGEVFASMFLLDTVLRGVRREETEERLAGAGVFEKVFDAILASDAEGDGAVSQVIVKQLLFRVVQLDSGLAFREEYQDVVKSSIEVLKKEVELSSKKTSKKWNSTPALKFAEMVFCLETVLHYTDVTKIVIPEVGGILNTILKNGASYNQAKGTPERWNGEVFVGLNWGSFAVVVLYAATKKWLGVLSMLETASPSEFIAAFVAMVYSCPPEQEVGKKGKGISARSVWEDMLSSTVIYELPVLRDQCLNSIMNPKNSSIANNNTWYHLYLETIAKFPQEAIRSDFKEQTKDSIFILNFTTTLDAPAAEKSVLARKERALLARLMDSAKTTTGPISDPKKLVEWFNACGVTSEEEEDSRRVKATTATARKILRRAIVDVEQPHNQGYLVKLAKELYASVGKTKIITPSWTLAVCFLRECWGCTVEEVKSEAVKLREKMISKATKWLESATEEARLIAKLLPIYAEVVFLDGGSEDAELVVQAQRRFTKLLEHWLPVWNGKSSEDVSAEEQEKLREILVGLVGLRCQCPQTESTIEPTIAFVVFALEYSPNTPSYKAAILQHFAHMASKLPTATFLKGISVVKDACFPFSKEAGAEYYSLLRILLKATRREQGSSEDVTARNTQLHDAVAKIYSSICLALPKSTSQEMFLTLLDCMGIVLKALPWAIIQFNIDETLTAITICTSPSGPTFIPTSSTTTTTTTTTSSSSSSALAESPTDAIYISLTRVLLSILLGHRIRLKGRYHLLITLLQSFLRLLFQLPPQLLKKSDTPLHPPWLPSTLPLTTLSSRAYTRLLTTLCDPPASTVSTSKKSHSTSASTTSMLLTSHTNLARKEVARYIPYVMMEFIHLQLNRNGGRMVLDKGVREALTQGLYAMFEVMKAEEGTLKILSAALDAQGRVVLKRMYEEFGKFGVEK